MARNQRDNSKQRTYHVTAKSGHIGATAGWVTASNTVGVQLPQNQTASTYVIPLGFLREGWIIQALKINGQMESGGNSVSMTAKLQKSISGTADNTETTIATITVSAKTADYRIVDTGSGINETVGPGFYSILLTGTTGASTDIDFIGVGVTVDEGLEA